MIDRKKCCELEDTRLGDWRIYKGSETNKMPVYAGLGNDARVYLF